MGILAETNPDSLGKKQTKRICSEKGQVYNFQPPMVPRGDEVNPASLFSSSPSLNDKGKKFL